MRNSFTLLVLLGCASAAVYWAVQLGGRAAWLCVYGATIVLAYLCLIHVGVLRGVIVRRRLNHKRCAAGEATRIELQMQFRRPIISSSYLAIEEAWRHIGTGEWILLREICRPVSSRSVSVALTLPGLPRGLYRLETVQVTISDGFGLLRRSRRMAAGEHELLVLPRPLPVPVSADGAGDDATRFSRQPLQRQAASPFVYGTRPYAPGDPLNRIHWRSTARTGALRAKESEQPGSDRLLICIDAAGGRSNAEAFESAIEAAAGLAKRGLELGLSVRLAAGDRQGRALEARGHERLPALLQLLALLPCDGDRPLAAWVQRETLQLGPGAGVAVVTARPDAQLLRLLCRLRGRAVHLVCIHGAGDQPGTVQHWRQQAEAAGCRFTAVPAGRAYAAEGGERDARSQA
ncbi:DUF58 domain-containing protein [Paenibacillus xerothermodurans]|uniref:Uncharacterized protein n=1 Tax=Paenibacillus xerothermodurans TaxID=1977292 RepID=A0A2W1N8W5_PAEXE|nr:DUF58 domain-containing protein [Paenibacillus xerothermodurans]PZE20837.1 hypothetical protein CBW46_011845 [Paenibacillus xerothermodurans]